MRMLCILIAMLALLQGTGCECGCEHCFIDTETEYIQDVYKDTWDEWDVWKYCDDWEYWDEWFEDFRDRIILDDPQYYVFMEE